MKRRSFFGSLLALALPTTGAVPKTTLLPGRYEWEAPVVCVVDDVVNDIAIYAGGITWIDRSNYPSRIDIEARITDALNGCGVPSSWRDRLCIDIERLERIASLRGRS